jgi:hypothetical protein
MKLLYEKYRNLCLSATRAKIAYLPIEEVIKLWSDYKNDQDSIIYYIFDGVEECPKFYKDDMNTVHAYSWIQNRTLHITFRGIAEIDDIITDIKLNRAWLFPNGDRSILVNKRFLLYFQSLEKEITEEIYNNSTKFDEIHFNGHSLGAAITTIAACWYGGILKNNKKIINHTIGCPRVGNDKFVNFYNNCIIENIRVANNTDPITLFPISLFYNHVDNCLYMYENGSATEETKDIQWALRPVSLPISINMDYKKLLINHKCDIYINRLLKLANWNIKSIKLNI